MSFVRRYGLAIAVLGAGLAGCGKEPIAPPPPSPAPPSVSGAIPNPGAVSVPFDRPIVVAFSTSMNRTSVDDRTCTVRDDASYVPIVMTWNDESDTLTIVPQKALPLRRWITVSLSKEIRSSHGVPMDTDVFWQFETSALREPHLPNPAHRASHQAPFPRLSWQRAGVPVDIVFTVFAGTDSGQVAARSTPYAITTDTAVVCNPAWPLGAAIFWAVRAQDPSGDAHLDGPVWRFETRSEALTDSVTLELGDWSQFDFATETRQCFGGQFVTGPQYTTAIRWNLEPFRGLVIERATIHLILAPDNVSYSSPSLHSSTSYWNACDIQPGGAPHEGATLAPGPTGRDGRILRFETQALSAHVQAMLTSDGYYGFLVKTVFEQNYIASGSLLRLHYYKSGANVTPSPFRTASSSESRPRAARLQSHREYQR